MKGADLSPFSLYTLDLSPVDLLHHRPGSQLKPLASSNLGKTKRVASLIENCISFFTALTKLLLLSRLVIGPLCFAFVLLYFRVSGEHGELWSVQKSTLPVKVKRVGADPRTCLCSSVFGNKYLL